jgi:UDP-GlcNAc:undecaprenyl-phosphate/decaprenyl-phosphate GlcNAc-1-phosphate transferase
MIFFISSFFICLVLPVILKKFLSKSRLATNKEKPMLLGLSIYLSVFIIYICVSIYYKINIPFPATILAGSSFMLLIGIIDDIKNLSVKAKLTGQIIASCIVIFMGVRTSIVYFPVWINMIITLIWIVALVNAFNFLDILDGLCTGISLIISVAFLAVSIASGMHTVSLFFWILSGAILAAFIHNIPAARFYLGDSGSMLIGFIFACSTMQISYAPDASHRLSLFVPILIVFLPVYDLIFTVFMRLKKGKVIFEKSGEHFALMLKSKGYSIRRILAIMYTICLISAASAFSLKVAPLFLKSWFLAFFVLAVCVFNIYVLKIYKTIKQ